jgi:hypothetical protein
MKPKTLDQMIDEMGYSAKVAEHVRLGVEQLGTEAAILSGERVLPHPIDAHKHWLRETGQWGKSETERKLEEEVAELRASVAALVAKGK